MLQHLSCAGPEVRTNPACVRPAPAGRTPAANARRAGWRTSAAALGSFLWLWIGFSLICPTTSTATTSTATTSTATTSTATTSTATASTATTPAGRTDQPDQVSQPVRVSLGLDGIIRLGFWTPAQLLVRDAELARQIARLEIVCPDDGDGPVRWTQAVRAQSATADPSLAVVRGLFRLGRPRGIIALTLFDGAGKQLWREELRLESTPEISVIDGSEGITLILGPDTGLEKLVPANGTGRTRTRIARLDSADLLPDSVLGFQSAHRLIAGGQGTPLLQALSPEQTEALQLAIQRGSRMLVLAPPPGQSLPAGFARLLPGQTGPASELVEVGRLEFYARARTQLKVSRSQPLPFCQFTPSADATPVMAEGEQIVFVRQPSGFGLLVWSGVGLDQNPFLEWPSTTSLLESLLMGSLMESQSTLSGRVGQGSGEAPEDLAGQLRTALENFPSVQLVSFTFVALLAALAVVLFGIGDWFLLKHVIRVPALTWITFPLMVVAVSGLGWYLHGRSRPAEPHLNSIEVLDLDQVTGTLRGSSWNCLFSPDSTPANVDFVPAEDWKGEPLVTATGWQGQPGSGLGGMLTRTGISLSPGVYSVDLTAPGTTGAATGWRASIAGMSQSPSSARLFFSETLARLPQPEPSRLRLNRLRNRLEGTIVNTAPVTLRRGRIFWGNSVYLLPRDLEPGESIAVSELVERTAASILNRRGKVEDKARKDLMASTPWDPADTDYFRIASMLMFHQLAGGSSYTGQGQSYYEWLEMSDLVQLNRVVLAGEYDQPAGEFRCVADGSAAPVPDQALRILRIVIPVQSADSPPDGQP